MRRESAPENPEVQFCHFPPIEHQFILYEGQKESERERFITFRIAGGGREILIFSSFPTRMEATIWQVLVRSKNVSLSVSRYAPVTENTPEHQQSNSTIYRRDREHQMLESDWLRRKAQHSPVRKSWMAAISGSPFRGVTRLAFVYVRSKGRGVYFIIRRSSDALIDMVSLSHPHEHERFSFSLLRLRQVKVHLVSVKVSVVRRANTFVKTKRPMRFHTRLEENTRELYRKRHKGCVLTPIPWINLIVIHELLIHFDSDFNLHDKFYKNNISTTTVNHTEYFRCNQPKQKNY